MDIAVLLLSMCFFFAIGMPIAFALALSALVGALWIDLPVGAVMQQFASGVGKVSMLTIPFFVLAGAIMAEGGMARRLVDFAAVVIGFTRIRGGLSQVNILATTIMSGISGSSVADTSAIGSVMIPQMAEKGYPRVFATNVTISASLQAIIVPQQDLARIRAAVEQVYGDRVGSGSGGLSQDIVVITARESKGLEFDGVLILEPAELVADPSPHVFEHGGRQPTYELRRELCDRVVVAARHQVCNQRLGDGDDLPVIRRHSGLAGVKLHRHSPGLGVVPSCARAPAWQETACPRP